jgi:hypothetical protein
MPMARVGNATDFYRHPGIVVERLLLHDRDVSQSIVVVWRAADGAHRFSTAGYWLAISSTRSASGTCSGWKSTPFTPARIAAWPPRQIVSVARAVNAEATVFPQDPDRQFQIVQPAIEAEGHTQPDRPLLSRRRCAGRRSDVASEEATREPARRQAFHASSSLRRVDERRVSRLELGGEFLDDSSKRSSGTSRRDRCGERDTREVTHIFESAARWTAAMNTLQSRAAASGFLRPAAVSL